MSRERGKGGRTWWWGDLGCAARGRGSRREQRMVTRTIGKRFFSFPRGVVEVVYTRVWCTSARHLQNLRGHSCMGGVLVSVNGAAQWTKVWNAAISLCVRYGKF